MRRCHTASMLWWSSASPGQCQSLGSFQLSHRTPFLTMTQLRSSRSFPTPPSTARLILKQTCGLVLRWLAYLLARLA